MYTLESLGIDITLTFFPWGAIHTKSIASERFPLNGSPSFSAASTPITRIFCLFGENGRENSTLFSGSETFCARVPTSPKKFTTSLLYKTTAIIIRIKKLPKKDLKKLPATF